MNCPYCNSENIKETGIVMYSCPAYIEYQCLNCNKTFEIQEEQGIKQLSIVDSIKHKPTMYLKQWNIPCCFNCSNYNRNKDGFNCKFLKQTTLPMDICIMFKNSERTLTKEEIKTIYPDASKQFIKDFLKEIKE